MAEDFVICVRDIKKGKFGVEPAETRFLFVPEEEDLPSPKHALPKRRENFWFQKVRKAAVWGKDERKEDLDRGDVLIFVHGYNNDQLTVMKRHRRLKKDLAGVGFKGVIVSFDWPSDKKVLNYAEDRHDAKQSAMKLVSKGISKLAEEQTAECSINIHLLGHSTGAYVIREAFDDADDAKLANNSWAVSQVILIGGDISSASLTEGNSSTESLYRHCARLTNYSNLRDYVLKLSNAKRLGMAARAGRVGLPVDAPSKAVNVDCTEYFKTLDSIENIRKSDQHEEIGTFCHSWHIGNEQFISDLFETLKGDLDRTVLPTRIIGPDGKLHLKPI